MKRYAGEQLTRTVELDRSAVNEKARTVSLSFSSEQPVERYFGTEILSHAPGAVDLSRLNAGGAVLVEHDSRDLVGTVVKATIDADRKGRAVVRFGKSALAEEIFQDVVGSIRNLISVGYRITETVKEAGDVIRATKWQPMEISLVAVPADQSAGVGRSQSSTQNHMSLEVTSENSRAAEINAIAEHIGDRVPGIRDMAARSILSGQSLQEFRAAAMSLLPKAQPVMPCAPLDVRPREWQRYSLARAITQKLKGHLDGFEAEVDQELALRNGSKASGFFVPDEIMARNAIAGTPTLGGMLVQVDNRGDMFIELLRNQSQCVNLGARVVNLSRGCTIPRQNGAHTVNWVTETTASTLSGINLQHLTLTPKAITSNVQYSKLLLMESDPSIDGILRDDITAQLAIAIDLAAIHGTGSAQPVGILGTSGIGSVLLSSNGLALNNATAYPFLVSLESVCAVANAPSGSRGGYLMRPSVRGQLKVAQRFASTDSPVWSENNRVNGYRAEVSSQVSNALTEGTATTITSPIIYSSDWSELLIGNFGNTDLVCDEYTLAKNRVIRLIATRYVDVGVRHAASFCAGGGVIAS